ncbi:leucine-rich repeat and IQ domain-containing protein 1 [Crotalus adamanteus]|uniref:Leucine-rich repeat and IQ domain-containing protein 1 n=1 Tax=Crotalus adamanteus TaxID=8729 RepID=A0AAW1BCJ0_CROAD
MLPSCGSLPLCFPYISVTLGSHSKGVSAHVSCHYGYTSCNSEARCSQVLHSQSERMEEEYDDVGIEEEIERDLKKINYSSYEADDCNTDLSAESSSDSETYLDFVRSISQNAEKLLLQDLENVEISSDIYCIVPNNASEYLAELASQYNEDPEEFKKRVLSEIEGEQMSEASDSTIELKTDQDSSSKNIADGYSLADANDIPINFSFQEVEGRCKQEYQYWLEKQKVLEEEKLNQLKAKKDMEISQNEEEKRRRQLRQEELETERLNLEMFNAQQQTVMEEELLKKEQTWKEQLKEHEAFIMKLHIQIEEERKAFEEQKAKERQQLMEQQNNAAIKIQTTFRAFMIYKRFGPVLKKKREERKKKREMKEIMEKEMKEKEERWKRRVLEKMEQKKEERKRREEKEKKENEEKLRRHEEYEKKKETEHQMKKMAERNKPRKCSFDQLPPLSATMIIQAGPWSSLQQVTTVNFQDLPGCSLSTLSQCARLQFLSLRRCGLLALEGFSNCKELKYIDIEENNIQFINCENLENLCVLILNKNNISSLHGLYGCSNLLNLELSYNKITRIGGLETLKKLQRLVVDHNQLISTKGLSATPTLLYLDCSFNHLSHIEGIENCGLLQILKLQGNNLSEFPNLENHVLLRELYLEDNNISRLGKFTEYWLPLLQILFISQNSLTQLVSLCSYVSLEKLNISNNCLLDLKTLIQCLEGCNSLRELSLLGNPLLQENNWRCSLLKNLPTLKILNDENVSCDAEKVYEKTLKSETLAAFCQAQIQEIVSLNKKATTRLDKFSEDSIQLQCCYLKKVMKLSIEHRYAQDEESSALISPKRNKFNRQITTIDRGNYLQHFDNSQNSAAIIIQSCWRGYKVRKEINFYTRLHLAAAVIQSAWRSYCIRRNIVSCEKKNNHFMDRHKAATILQALWKGFRLRKKLASALAAVKTHEVEDDYKEINVDEFVFNEAVIEKEWPALDSNCFLSQTVLCSDQLPSPKCNKPVGSQDSSFHLKSPPHKMWQFRKMSTLSENNQINNRSGRSTASQLSDMKPSQKLLLQSEKEEKISEEWGFKDISTAQLMLKRAHKMKAKKYNAKKIDPAARLALFKNNENKHPPVKPPKKPQTTKIGYFEGKGEEFSHLDFATERMQRSKERTCQWLYTQVWDYEGASPRTEKCKHFLPEIDPEVLKGGRVQLVTSPVRREDTDLELVSLTSGSTLTQNREKNNQPHRHSAESLKKDTPSPEKSQLSPAHKERISFRDHPVQLSAGWGSGKKKTKLLK